MRGKNKRIKQKRRAEKREKRTRIVGANRFCGTIGAGSKGKAGMLISLELFLFLVSNSRLLRNDFEFCKNNSPSSLFPSLLRWLRILDLLILMFCLDGSKMSKFPFGFQKMVHCFHAAYTQSSPVFFFEREQKESTIKEFWTE